MFSTQAFSFRNDGDGVELRFKLEGEIFLSYILSDPQLLWILYFLETSNWIVRYNNRTDLYLECDYLIIGDSTSINLLHVAYKSRCGQSISDNGARDRGKSSLF